MVYSCNGILSPSINEWTRSMFFNINTSLVHNIEWKKQVTKGHMQCDEFM